MNLKKYLQNQLFHDRNTRKRLANIDNDISNIRYELNQLYIQQRIYDIQNKVLSCTQSGITSEKLCEEEVIVTLTTFGKRIYDVYLAIESIMQGTITPNRIILWLSEKEFKGQKLPQTLVLQQQRGLEIAYCEDIRSYKKLIPTLKAYPETTLITIDDDAIYEFDIIERLINAHIKNPKAVCSCRTHRITLNNEGRPNSYLDWEMCTSYTDTSPLNFPTGVGCILYPPHSLHPEVLNQDLFSRICPTADDIWFHAMAVMNDTPILHVDTPKPEGYYISIPSSNIGALCSSNTDPDNCMNDFQLKAVYDKYDLFSKLY